MTLFYIFSALLLLPLVVLAIPIEIEYRYDSTATQKSVTRIVWLFGLIRFQLGGASDRAIHFDDIPDIPTEQRRTSHPRSGRNKKGLRVFLALLRSEGFIRRALRLLYEILTVARIKELRGQIQFGLDDPADTGRLYGLLAPGLSFLYALPQVEFAATPVFDRNTAEADLQTKIRLVPLNYPKAVLLFLCSPETRRALRAAKRALQQ